jgi:hypothetical protein
MPKRFADPKAGDLHRSKGVLLRSFCVAKLSIVP